MHILPLCPVVRRGSSSLRSDFSVAQRVRLIYYSLTCVTYARLVLLVDECTSGVDPLSRPPLWKILTSFREDRSVVFLHVCLFQPSTH